MHIKPLLKILIFLVLYTPASGFGQNLYDYPFQDPSLSTEERVNDLVGRMTLEEKIYQMMNTAPAIERLNVPEYNWWNECLHGVARAGLATVFPQAIGLGATWDEDLMFRISTAISDEARAKHHDFVKNGKRFIYQGLTFWSPNINIFRDPRWGRGQETYGEDPFLTGKLGVQFIKGLQGDDPTYFKTIATVKHYAVHSGPEPERHSFDAVTDERDLRETYLPQFEMGIKEGKAYSVMCAYNRYKGEACCGSNRLLNTILRDEWGFDGYIVSDCGAIADIYKYHKVVATPEEAASLAVKSGCDLECATVYIALKEAAEKNLITEQEIDVAVKRLFTARFRLGMFDPPEMVKYTNIPISVVDSKENQELALEAARKSVVLLKNENNLLPLKKNLKTIAVIGPNSNGIPSDPITPLRGIQEKLPGSKVLYAQGSEVAEGMPVFEPVSSKVLFHKENNNGLYVDYYDNRDLKGNVLFSSVDSTLDANWKNKAPREDMDGDNFGVRWSGELRPDLSGKYQLGVITTCRINLYLNDSLIVNTSYHFRDEYSDPRLRKSSPLQLEAGKSYKIRVEAGESYADAQVQLVWSKPAKYNRQELKNQALDIARQADAVIMCMGLSAKLEGEQLDIDIEGFRGGDRTRLDLPETQQELVKEIYALGKPVILVLLNGSALAINWEKDNIPAIIEAWYPGQAAGQAIADVIFGDYNPAGRLPVTFYKSAEDLPPFEEYSMIGKTYRYFSGAPLYPFGYGLSYTSFKYNDLRVAEKCRIGDTVQVSVQVKNEGQLAGDEVIQLYLSNTGASVPVALRSLKGFKRIHLLPGENKLVKFSIPPDAFSIINDANEKVIIPGSFTFFVGGHQPENAVDLSVLKADIALF
jgi:beta-glucosidase